MIKILFFTISPIIFIIGCLKLISMDIEESLNNIQIEIKEEEILDQLVYKY